MEKELTENALVSVPDKGDQEEFQKYYVDRYEKQISWYTKKANHNHKMYDRYQVVTIICALSAPIVTALFSTEWKAIPVILSASTAILVALHNHFKYHEKWMRHRFYAEKLRREQYYFEHSIFEYALDDNALKRKMFVERVEGIIEEEQSEWQEKHSKVSSMSKVLKPED